MFKAKPPIVIAASTKTEYATREVNVHRAPTDESVRLLKEMEDAARNRIVDSMYIEDTACACVVQSFDNVIDRSISLVATLSINGEKMEVEYRGRDAPEAAVIKLRDMVAVRIAETILHPALGTTMLSKMRVF